MGNFLGSLVVKIPPYNSGGVGSISGPGTKIPYAVLSHLVISSSLRPMDCSPPGSSVHGIVQARILEWVAVPFSRGPSQPRDGTCVSYVSCIGRQVFTTSAIREDPCLYWMMLTWIVPLTKCCLCLDSQPIPAARNSLG